MGTDNSSTPAPGRRPGRRWLRNAVIGAMTVGIATGVALVVPGSASAAGCGGVVDAPSLTDFTLGTTFADTRLAGGPGASVEYTFRVSGTRPEIRVDVQAQGYVNGQARWFTLPTGSSGGGQVPWDVASGTPGLRAASLHIGTPVTFECSPVGGQDTPVGQ